MKNIVLFGATGAGKSSVVNLMAGQERAKTSPDMERCTMQWEKHSITFDGYSYQVFDTVGLEDPLLGTKEYLDIIVNAYKLVTKLQEEGGIDLLLFCVRIGRFSMVIQNNYRLFYEWLCEKKVPIVLVLTGLEEEEEDMDNWWIKERHTFDTYGIVVAGHACITAADGLDGRHKLQYEESRRLVRNVVREHTHERRGVVRTSSEGWYRRFIRELRVLLMGKYTPKRKDVVTVLTKRCGIPREAAVQLARQVREDSFIS